MLFLDKIAGLMADDREEDWVYKSRDRLQDFADTRKYYRENPPKLADAVVVLSTQYSHGLDKPDVTSIEAITERGRIVVNHCYASLGYAGKSFYDSGQNCKAPKGQVWLVPAELYRDIPIRKDIHNARKDKERQESKKANISELAEFYGVDYVLENIKELMLLKKCSYENAKALLKIEMEDEKTIKRFDIRNAGGGRVSRLDIKQTRRRA